MNTETAEMNWGGGGGDKPQQGCVIRYANYHQPNHTLSFGAPIQRCPDIKIFWKGPSSLCAVGLPEAVGGYIAKAFPEPTGLPPNGGLFCPLNGFFS